MVKSPMYKRLMQFVEDAKANESLANLDLKHRTTMDAINEAERRLRHYREYQGFRGQTGTAIDKWLADAEQRLQDWRESYLATAQVEVEMRRVMQHAREEAEMLSPVLVDSRLDALRDMAEVTIPVMQNLGIFGAGVNAVASTGAAVYDAVAAQANAQREANSADILRRLNDSMRELANHAREVHSKRTGSRKDKTRGITDYPSVSAPWVAKELENGNKSVSPDDPGVYPGDRGSDYGRADQRGANSGAYPSGYDDPSAEGADAERLRKMQSQRIADKFTTEGELGSRSKPITDPKDLMGVDLLHSRIGGERYANGLTRGGYTPAPPSDRHHPLWRINGGPSTRFDASGRTSLAGAGALGAGVLGAGALGAAALGARSGSGLGAGSLGALGRGGAGGLGASGRGGLGAGGLGASGRGGLGSGGLGASGRGSAGGLGGLRGSSSSRGGFGASGLPGSTSASGGTTGLTGTNGAGGAAGAAGKAGGGSAAGGAGAAGRPGMGGFMGAGAGAGAGGSKDDKKGRRRKYAAFKFEDDEDDALPPGYVNPMSQTYGSDKDLKPASQKDDGWDPRQW
ncbi:MAG: hypothetical protein KHZ63_06975 [Actinomyces sp.]|nr:hypothetical protein [Actinomyces sp.]